MDSIARITIIKIANQLLLNSDGAKKPKIYSTTAISPKIKVREYLNASFKDIDETIQRTIPPNKITALFKYTFVSW